MPKKYLAEVEVTLRVLVEIEKPDDWEQDEYALAEDARGTVFQVTSRKGVSIGGMYVMPRADRPVTLRIEDGEGQEIYNYFN